MKKKKGFISVSVIYSFFIVFLLVMLAMLADYINKRHLLDKNQTPQDGVCTKSDSLSSCIQKLEDKSDTLYQYDIIKQNPTQCVTEPGLYKSKDDYGDTLFYSGAVDNNYVAFGGYMWRIVRINGDGSIRLIYTGELDSDYRLKAGSKPYISVKEPGTVSGIDDVTTVRFNYSLADNDNCKVDLTRTFETAPTIAMCDATGLDKYYARVKCYASLLEKKGINISDESTYYEGCDNEYCRENHDKVIANYKAAIKRFNKLCRDIDEEPDKVLKAAYMPNRIGYMNNPSGSIARYDSEFDNSDDSVVKKYVDLWYKDNFTGTTAKNKYGSFLKSDTIFCGDKEFVNNQSWEGHKNAVYEYAANIRIPNGGASFECIDTGSTAVDKGDYLFGNSIDNISNQTIDRYSKSVANYSRYNVGKRERVYYFEDSSILKLEMDGRIGTGDNKPIMIMGYYVKKETKDGSSKILRNNSFKYILDDSKGKYTGTGDYFNVNENNGKYSLGSRIGNQDDLITKRNSLKEQFNGIPLGNGSLTYPIALLSADEAVKAGLIYTKSAVSGYPYITNNTADCYSYLLDEMPNKTGFWTMTLARTDTFIGSDENTRLGASYFVVTSDKLMISKERNGKDISLGYYMRPVINIKDLDNKDKKNYTINYSNASVDRPGTKNNPIIIGE